MWPVVDIGHRREVKVLGGATVGIESLNQSPKIFFLQDLITEEEADHFVKIHESAMEESTVGTIDAGISPGRTSLNTWDQHSPEAQLVIKRCFELLRIPYDLNMQDGLQIV